MKYSISKQFAAIFIGLMAGTILLCWFINNTFLEEYYVQNKQKVLTDAYYQVVEATKQGSIATDEFNLTLQRICNRYNINVLILDASSKTLVSSSDSKFLSTQLWDKIFGPKNPEDKILKETDEYVMQNTMDKRTQTEYIEMWGIMENGNLFLIQTALEGIRDSVDIANRFLAYVGIFTALLGAVVIYFVSGKVAAPIMELTDISRRMTDLDFDVKYQGESKNEVALLGHHMNQLSEVLEKTISELKTANNELQQDIEKKTKMDEMRKEFLSNVSHELKTPIALIQGYAEGLMEGVNDDKESLDFYCEVIVDEASRMNEMVKKLMELNQLEFGNDTLKFERFDIAELLENTILSTEILTRQAGITVRFESVGTVFVWADEFKTEEVIRNYLSNAIHHASDQKLIDIKIREAEECVRISVFNTGSPIPEEAIPYLWDKFYKVDKARTREYGGSGVGLSIVKAIMDSMDQRYGVINYTNGVEFWFELSHLALSEK